MKVFKWNEFMAFDIDSHREDYKNLIRNGKLNELYARLRKKVSEYKNSNIQYNEFNVVEYVKKLQKEVEEETK